MFKLICFSVTNDKISICVNEPDLNSLSRTEITKDSVILPTVGRIPTSRDFQIAFDTFKQLQSDNVIVYKKLQSLYSNLFENDDLIARDFKSLNF
jgi:hypothetical protein